MDAERVAAETSWILSRFKFLFDVLLCVYSPPNGNIHSLDILSYLFTLFNANARDFGWGCYSITLLTMSACKTVCPVGSGWIQGCVFFTSIRCGQYLPSRVPRPWSGVFCVIIRVSPVILAQVEGGMCRSLHRWPIFLKKAYGDRMRRCRTNVGLAAL